MTLAYIALGSNLGDSRQQITHAMTALAALPATRLLQRSALYRTPPWGVLEQPPFVNAAVQVDTALLPHDLLAGLWQIETDAGRIRAERNGPRLLDLDLIHIDGVQMNDERLTLPHPRVAERAFVLVPLNDIAPTLEIPGHGSVQDLLAKVGLGGCVKLT